MANKKKQSFVEGNKEVTFGKPKKYEDGGRTKTYKDLDPSVRDKASAWNKKTYGTDNPTADAKKRGMTKAELAKSYQKIRASATVEKKPDAPSPANVRGRAAEAAYDDESATIKGRMQASLKAPLPAKSKPAPASISGGAKKAELVSPAAPAKPQSKKMVRKGNRIDRKDARVAKRKGKKATAASMTSSERKKVEGSIKAAQRFK
jgi:hypothetical protein